jgi:outer membrane protein, adhesin transport system
MNSSKIMAFAGTALFFLALMHFPAKAENLASAVDLALQNHPAIKAALSSQSAAVEEVNISKAQSRPRLDASANNRTSLSPNGTIDTLGVQLSASKSLYDGGAGKSELMRSTAELDAEQQRVNDQMNEVALQTVQAYIDILQGREKLQALDREMKLLNDIGRRVNLRVSAGFGSETDTLDVQLKIQNAELIRIDARQQARKALIDYRNMVGAEPGRLVAVAFPTTALPADIDTAIELAKHSSPRIKSLLYDANAADALAEGIRASQKPKLEFDIGVNQNRDIGKSWAESHDLSARLVLSVNLYDGGSTKAKSRKARYSAYATRYRAKATALALEQQLRLLWSALELGRERAAILHRQKQATERSLVLQLQRFDAGVAPLQTILDLQSQSTAAGMAGISERFSSLSNAYLLLAGTGRLLPSLGLRFNVQAPRNG